ncbi:MAG: oligosaccharide repeat unit polymerase, partial [Methanobrevibacter sp.]|nr:oligosaccharide repeat unit polymerase [Methanobrevibacter sp.]
MSVIYSSLTSIINKISDAIHESFLFTLIFTILGFIENQWVNSYFKRFYPGENFLNFLNRNVVLKEYLFHPLIVLLV